MKTINFKRHMVTRALPVNIEEKDLYIFHPELKKDIHESCTIILSHGFFFHDVAIRGWNLFRKYYINHTISRKSFFKRLLRGFKGFIDVQYVICIADNNSDWYFHWMMDSLPRLLNAADAIKKEDICNYSVLIPEKFKTIHFIPATLNHFNVEPTFYSSTRVFRFKQLVIPTLTAPMGNYNENLVKRLRSVFLEQESGTWLKRKIYVSRLKANKRKVLNEQDVILLMKKLGYEIHFLEDYSFDEQLALLNSSRFFVSMHGAGLTNMLFMKPGCFVLELKNSRDVYNNCYFSLASTLNLKYYYLLCDGDDLPVLYHNMVVDTSELEKTVLLMEANATDLN